MLNVWKQIQKLETIDELIDFIHPKGIQRFSFFVLIYWILSPLFILFHLQEAVNEDPFTLLLNNMHRISYWQTLLIQVGLMGLGVGFILVIIHLKRKTFRLSIRHLEFILLALFIIWAILSFLVNTEKDLTWMGNTHRQEGLYAYLMYTGIFILATQIKEKKYMTTLLKFFIFVASFLVLLMFINSEAINSFFNISFKTSVFFNQNHFAYYLSMAIMASAYLYLNELKIIYLFIFVGLVSALSFNGSFGPMLAVIVGISTLVILLKMSHVLHQKYLWILLIAFTITLLLSNLFSQRLLNDFFRLGNDIGNIIEEADDVGLAGSARWQLWVNGIEFIKQRPLFGYGIDNLAKQYELVNISIDRPHNELIQFATSMGLISALLYLSALVSTLIKMIKHFKNINLISLSIFSIALSYFISSMFGNTMIYTTPYYVIFLALTIQRVNEL